MTHRHFGRFFADPVGMPAQPGGADSMTDPLVESAPPTFATGAPTTGQPAAGEELPPAPSPAANTREVRS